MKGKLEDWVAGTTHISPLLTWQDQGGNLVDLTGAVISGRIRELSKSEIRDVLGTVTPDPDQTTNKGQATWDLNAADVIAGNWEVQFKAVFASKPLVTFISDWYIEEAI